MRMNRRNVLVGLGTIVAGGGAALGTGAFSSVEANRTVTVDTAGDAGAFLELDSANTELASMTDGLLEINLDGGTNANGLNVNATTTADPLFTATNNGENPVGLQITNAEGASISNNTITVNVEESDGTDAGTLDITFYESDGDPDSHSIINSPIDLAAGGTTGNSQDIAVEIDTNNVDTDDPDSVNILVESITIEADTETHSA